MLKASQWLQLPEIKTRSWRQPTRLCAEGRSPDLLVPRHPPPQLQLPLWPQGLLSAHEWHTRSSTGLLLLPPLSLPGPASSLCQPSAQGRAWQVVELAVRPMPLDCRAVVLARTRPPPLAHSGLLRSSYQLLTYLQRTLTVPLRPHGSVYLGRYRLLGKQL